MPAPGRNDPCPCGSGRKYKKCCGNPVGADDLARLYDALSRLTTRAPVEQEVQQAWHICFRDDEAEHDEGLPEEVAVLHRALFFDWLWFDFVLTGGATVVQRLLAGDVSALTPGARRLAATAAQAPLRCLLVESVDPGQRVWISDAIDPTVPQQVADEAASRTLAVRDAILGRVATVGDRRQFIGTTCLLDRGDPPHLAHLVRKMRRRMMAEAPSIGLALRRAMDAAAMLRFVIAMDDAVEQPATPDSLIVLP